MAWALLGGPYTVPGGVYTLQGMSIPGDWGTYSFDKYVFIMLYFIAINRLCPQFQGGEGGKFLCW